MAVTFFRYVRAEWRTNCGAGPASATPIFLANPFGVFIRTPDVDAIAARVDDLVVRPAAILRHREWGLYEVGLSGPDGMLVRIGWPSRLMQAASTEGG
jgi:hypothetical protein